MTLILFSVEKKRKTIVLLCEYKKAYQRHIVKRLSQKKVV